MKETRFGFTTPGVPPGALMIIGRRTPASYKVLLELTKGGPLSLVNMTNVLSSSPASESFFQQHADALVHPPDGSYSIQTTPVALPARRSGKTEWMTSLGS